MGHNVTVIYGDLEHSAGVLADAAGELNEVAEKLNGVSEKLSEVGEKHDGCFSKSIDAIDTLYRNFREYAFEAEWIGKACSQTASAFESAEEQNMAAAVNLANAMLGKEDTIDLTDTTVNSFKTHDDYDKSKVKVTDGGDSSLTWENTFVSSPDEPYVQINGDISTYAESLMNDDGDEGQGKSPETEHTPGTDPETTPYTPQYRVDPAPSPTPTPQPTSKPTSTPKPTKSPTPKPTETPKPTKSPTPTPTQKPTQSPTPTQTPTPTPTMSPVPGPTPEPVPEPTYVPTQNPTPAPTPDPGPWGGEYSDTEGYVSDNTETGIPETPVENSATSIDNVVSGNKYTKVPSSTNPIYSKSSKKSGSGILPIAAGLTAAAAAGIGAKAYMDHKNNNSDDNMEVESEDWDDNNSYEIEYDDASEKEEVLDEDNYNYEEEPIEAEPEKYGARTNEELADIQ